MSRAFYSASVEDFLVQEEDYILGVLARHNTYDLSTEKREAWSAQIHILKRERAACRKGWLTFEYTIPRMGKRVDNVLILRDHVFLLEFKVRATDYQQTARDQVTDYALDLQNFYRESHIAQKTLIITLPKTKSFLTCKGLPQLTTRPRFFQHSGVTVQTKKRKRAFILVL